MATPLGEQKDHFTHFQQLTLQGKLIEAIAWDIWSKQTKNMQDNPGQNKKRQEAHHLRTVDALQGESLANTVELNKTLMLL